MYSWARRKEKRLGSAVEPDGGTMNVMLGNWTSDSECWDVSENV